MADVSLREQIREANDIVDVAAELGIDFQARTPTAYKAVCPFHTIEGDKPEKTPSFHVDSTRQTYHCFSCGEGGDVYKLVQAMETIGFKAALKYLGRRVGICVAETPKEREEEKLRRAIYGLNEKATNYFQEMLQRSPWLKIICQEDTLNQKQEKNLDLVGHQTLGIH